MYITPTMPYLLSFAAGAMVFVVVDELIPSSHGNICNIEEIQKIAGIPIDHSFLKIQEGAYGIWLAGWKISMKEKTVVFNKAD